VAEPTGPARSGRPDDRLHAEPGIQFPTFEQGVACFQSDEYNKAAAFRRGGAGEVETVIVEGVEAGK